MLLLLPLVGPGLEAGGGLARSVPARALAFSGGFGDVFSSELSQNKVSIFKKKMNLRRKEEKTKIEPKPGLCVSVVDCRPMNQETPV